MRKLTSQSRKFLSTSSRFSRHNFSYLAVISTIIFGASCQLARKSAEESAQSPNAEPQLNLAVTPPLAPVATITEKSEWWDLYFKQGNDEIPVGKLLKFECNDAAAPYMTLELDTASAFGTYKAVLTIQGNDTQETIRATIGKSSMGFPSTVPVKSRLTSRACTAMKAGHSRVEVSRDTVDQFRDYLEAIAPDCEAIASDATGWFCKVPTVDPESAKQELVGVRTTMIRRWSRQPYLITRRLAVGIQIANALQNDDVEGSLDTFCKVIKDDLPQEIPIVMTSQKWQDSLCNKDSKYRVEAAMFGLAKTISEVDFMRQLFETTSKLGTLTIRVPRDTTPSGRFFVQLKPDANVNDGLTKAALKLWRADMGVDDAQNACWHPLFTENARLMEMARNLAMAGESTKAICDNPETSESTEGFVERYLADSITSETEFVISNGRSKLLRLPTGAYSYTLHPLPENQDDWDDASLSNTASTGVIEWSPKRPRPVINTWGG